MPIRRLIFALITMLIMAGCANVPQEVVDLSTTIGEDMAAVHQSHRQLIKQHFANIREQRLEYLEATWTPRYLQKWVVEGHLVQIANGKEVFDEVNEKFVVPTRGSESAQLLKSVQLWADAAIADIESKRAKLLGPVDSDERDLMASVDEAFARLFRGNAAITAHLNSVRKVQGAQDDVLKALNLKDLRTQINAALAKASEKAKLTKEELDDLEKDIQKAQPKVEKIKKRVLRSN